MHERRPNTVRALIDAYAAKKLRRKEKSTRDKYVYAVDHWADLLQREPTISDLTDDPVADFQDYLLDVVELAEDSVLMYLKKILALWRFAFHQRWVEAWPAVDLIDPAESIPVAWTADELRSLFRSLRNEQGFVGGVAAGPWWVGLHWTFWSTGERLGAVMRLRWEFVDFSTGTLQFPAKTRKGKKRGTCYRVGEHCLEALKSIREPRRELVFPFPYSRTTIWNQYRGCLRRAGLPTDRKRMFHALRKSVATHMEAAGHNATEALGHSDRSITLRHYVDPRIAGGIQPASVLFNPEF